jgi:hypothetical protein
MYVQMVFPDLNYSLLFQDHDTFTILCCKVQYDIAKHRKQKFHMQHPFHIYPF